MTENDSPIRRLHRRINPCETPGCSGNCAYAWSCHNTRLGKVGFFWPGIALMAALVGMVVLQ
ncbi:MAG: hypothetical protein EXR02_04460 [Rhodospirillales bacterium]|nr:hypothetical protein [Rhodospirillales bacterium]MSP80306.1 hypothetical protein [Rhodospirillales bacterium]